jgi:NADH-quinone oxidoreductase subunit L
MVIPLLALAVPSVISWVVNYNGWFGELLRGALPVPEADLTKETVNWGLAGASVAMAVAGIAVAYVIYVARQGLAETMGRVFKPLYVLFSNKWFADWIAEDFIVRRVVYQGISFAGEMFDRYVVDGVANGFGLVTSRGGALLRRVQSGEFQAYGFVFGAGVAVIAVVLIVVAR